jgi:amidase
VEPDPSIDAATSPFDRRVWRVVGDPLVRGARTAVTALPLAGIAVAVKDLIAVAGQPVGAGNPAWLAEQQPQLRSAPALEALLAAGADVVGIARTDEFAYSLAGTNVHYGTPPNPAAPGAISGGSTSGPASAVALGQAAVGLGTDTGGSIRIPASYQGLVGIRTSHGAIDTAGELPLAPAFRHGRLAHPRHSDGTARRGRATRRDRGPGSGRRPHRRAPGGTAVRLPRRLPRV